MGLDRSIAQAGRLLRQACANMTELYYSNAPSAQRSRCSQLGIPSGFAPGSSVRPLGNRHEKRGNWLRGTLLGEYRRAIGKYRRAVQIGTPGSGFGIRKIEHEMRIP